MNSPYDDNIVSIAVPPNFSREDIFELGRKAPYYKFVDFPVEITEEIAKSKIVQFCSEEEKQPFTKKLIKLIKEVMYKNSETVLLQDKLIKILGLENKKVRDITIYLNYENTPQVITTFLLDNKELGEIVQLLESCKFSELNKEPEVSNEGFLSKLSKESLKEKVCECPLEILMEKGCICKGA